LFLSENLRRENEINKNLLTDFLNNVASAGTTRAVQSLSQLLKTPVNIAEPATASLMSLDQVSARLAEQNHGGGLALGIEITGDLEGKLLLTFSAEDITRICRLIPRVPDNAGPEHPLVHSALLELCNILAGSFMSAISEYTGLDYQASPPILAIDMLDAIIISVLVDNNPSSEQVVFFDAQLRIEVEPFRGSILYFPTDSTTDKLINLRAGGD